MSKSSENAIKVDRECTQSCKSKIHAAQCIAAATKIAVSDRQLATYLFHLCANFAKRQDEAGRSVLHVAASCGRQELCQWLVTEAGAVPNARDFESGYTALHRAVYYGHVNVAVRLLQFGALLDACDNEDMTVIDMLSKERLSLDTLSLAMQCQPYVWGVNKNYSLGTGSDNTRKTPELIEFAKQSVSIVQAEMEELHSVYVSSCGRVWTCGMGQGGRLGSNSNKSSLTPQPIKITDKCVTASVSINHTLLLLENHTVMCFGSNTEHQLGVNPWVECCLSPRQICQSNFSSSNPITGICASRYHSVFYNDTAVWTCGLNAGQLGRAISDSSIYITQPMKVPLRLNGRKITNVTSSIGAIVVAVANGDVYILHKFQCKKMSSKLLDVVKISAFGGSLECENLSEHSSELKIILLNSRGSILLWTESGQHPTRCVFGTRQCINVVDFCLTQQHLLLVTRDGSAFQGTFTDQPQLQASVTCVGDKSTSKSNQFHKFVDRSKCYSVKLKRLPNVFRAVRIRADPKGNNFAVIQTHPKTALTDIPVISESEIPQQMAVLFQEASEDDFVHDAVLKVSGRLYPVHCFVLNLFGTVLAEEAHKEKLIVFNDTNPYIFEQILVFLYTGTCDLLRPGPFETTKINKKEDPLKMALEFCNRYKIQALCKKLQKLKYDMGKILLREGVSACAVTREPVKFDRSSASGMADVTMRAVDGSVVKAHRCVLVARLQYFHSMFLGGWSEAGADCVLPMPFSARVLTDIIDFIYTDEIPDHLSPEEDLDHIIRLLIAGDQLLVTRLKECCELLIINALTLRNAPTVLHLASVYNTPQLKASTIQFISLNLASFLQSRLLEPLDDITLKELSDYYRKLSKKEYRVITPLPGAPCDEEVVSLPPIPWPDEFSLNCKGEMLTELKSPSTVKKKKTPKKSSLSAAEGLQVTEPEVCQQQESTPQPASFDTMDNSTSPSNRITDKSVWNSQNCLIWEFSNEKSKSIIAYPPQRALESSRRMVPIVKLSQRERRRLNSESETVVAGSSPPSKPTRTWAVLPPAPNYSTIADSAEMDEYPGDSNFINIIASDKEKKANLAKMKSKSFYLTQLEEKAIDELMLFYNATNEFDERIKVERVFCQNIDKPLWITAKQP